MVCAVLVLQLLCVCTQVCPGVCLYVCLLVHEEIFGVCSSTWQYVWDQWLQAFSAVNCPSVCSAVYGLWYIRSYMGLLAAMYSCGMCLYILLIISLYTGLYVCVFVCVCVCSCMHVCVCMQQCASDC